MESKHALSLNLFNYFLLLPGASLLYVYVPYLLWQIPGIGSAFAAAASSMLFLYAFFLYSVLTYAGPGKRDRRLRCARKGAVIPWLLYTVFLLCPCILCLRSAFSFFLPDGGAALSAEASQSAPDPVRYLSALILSPAAEECVFRLFLYRRLRDASAVLPAGMASGLAFGLGHGSLFHAVFGTVFGMTMAFSYERTGKAAVPILCHALYNLEVLCFPQLEGTGPVPVIFAAVFLCVGTVLLARSSASGARAHPIRRMGGRRSVHPGE